MWNKRKQLNSRHLESLRCGTVLFLTEYCQAISNNVLALLGAINGEQLVKSLLCYSGVSDLAAPLELRVPRGEQGVIELSKLLVQTELTLREILPHAH